MEESNCQAMESSYLNLKGKEEMADEKDRSSKSGFSACLLLSMVNQHKQLNFEVFVSENRIIVLSHREGTL